MKYALTGEKTLTFRFPFDYNYSSSFQCRKSRDKLLFIIIGNGNNLIRQTGNTHQTMEKGRIISACAAVVLLSVFSAFAQHANDTLCFSIALNTDTNSLFCCRSSGDDMKMILSGPVIMENGSLLFYSGNGYALYSQTGTLIDSNSLFRENRKLSRDDPRRLKLAYPLDRSTILYYRKNPDRKEGLEIFQKKLCKKGLKNIEGADYANLYDIETAKLFNLSDNGITDEMATKSFLMPNLVGYASLTGGEKWWSLDRFYSFTSPLIVENNARVLSFFPGLLHDQKTDVQKHLINPLGTYVMDGRRYYYGIHSTLGSQDPESFQRLYLCDQAGNLLYSNEILKQTIVDAVLEYDKKSNTNYTVKRPGEYVFSPTVEKNGDIFYGVLDFEKRTLDVKKRLFYRYFARVVQPEHEDLVNIQRRFIFKPLNLSCPESERGKKLLPDMLYRDEKGKKRKALLREISCKGFHVAISREMNADLKKRLALKCSTLPNTIRHLQDSLATVSTASCPYGISIEQEGKGTLCTFYYGCNDNVLCARIINVTQTFEIFVRVDCENFSEVLVFSLDGMFLNRFTFNNQNFMARKDIIAVSDNRDIIEEDYERIAEDYTYLRWELSLKPPVVQ